MSVLACDRRGCTNIMCDRLSDNHGYICEECFAELCQKPQDFEEFMNSPKNKLCANQKEFWQDLCNLEFSFK